MSANSVPVASPKKLDVLDGLRGIAIVMVILFHLGTADTEPGFHPAVSSTLQWFRFGFSGVHLFLVLSGFCLTHSLLRRAEAGRSQGFYAYMKARWYRIAPPFYVAIGLYLAIPSALFLMGRSGSQTHLLTWKQIGTHLLFLHGFWPDTINAINVPFWSLALEFQFYLTLPILVALALRFGPWPVVLSVALSTVVFRGILIERTSGYEHLLNGCFLGRWAEFAFGMGAAFWYNTKGKRFEPPAVWIALSISLLALGAFLADAKNQWVADLTFGAGYTALLIAVLSSSDGLGGLGKLLAFAPLVWVGTISYSLYLTHSFILERVVQLYRRVVKHPQLATDLAMLATLLVLIVCGGFLFYRLVERRFVRSVDFVK